MSQSSIVTRLLSAGGSADTMWQKGRKYLFGVYITSQQVFHRHA